jgi:hypothetical protein
MATLPAKMPRDNDSAPMQVAAGSGNRANITAGAVTSNSTLPTGTYGLVIVRCTDYFWLNFGSGAVTASAAASSILVAPGEGVYPVPITATSFAGLRVGATDVALSSLKLSLLLKV